MEGNIPDIPPPLSEGQQLAKPVVKPQPEHQAVQKSGLALKLDETKASAHAHVEKATQLIEMVSVETEDQELQAAVTPEDARTQLEALAKGESIPPTEFLARSKQILRTSAQVRTQTRAETDLLERQRSSQSQTEWTIEERARELERAKGLGKIPAVIEKRILAGKKSANQKQLEQLDAQTQAKRQVMDQLAEQEKPIRLKQEETMLTEIGQEIKAIRTEYEQLLQEILTDGTLTSEIRENYIQQVLAPQADKIADERRLPAGRKDEFFSALRTCIEHRKDPEAQKQQYRNELDRFFNYENGFYNLQYACDPLLNGNDVTMISAFVAQMAAEDIVPIKTAVSPHLQNWESRNKFDDIFDNNVNPSRGLNGEENLFGRQVLSAINNGDDYIPNMDFWRAVKSSNAANEIFGDVIRQADQKYYTTALDKSLSDTQGGDIDTLVYYPTPDSIRNLVILAAADRQEYRTVHANWALSSLSRRSEWKQCLDEAEKVYPSLKPARAVLESWDFGEHWNHPDIGGCQEILLWPFLEIKLSIQD